MAGSGLETFDWGTTPLGPRADWSPALQAIYDMMMGTGFAVCAIWGPHRTLIYNEAYVPFLGDRHPDALGRPIASVWHDVWPDIAPLVERALAGESLTMQDMRLVMNRRGYDEETWWTFSYSPLRDTGEIVGMLNIATETTSRVHAERQNETVIRESTHRLKNTLAVVTAIAKQSLRGVQDREAVGDFEHRLQALGSAHDVLQQQDWDKAELHALLDSTLSKVADPDRYRLDGPALALSARVAQNLALVTHELATNAIKHGAWSRDGGRVAISWRADRTSFEMEWRETGGPAIVEPTKKSFGSKLIMGGLSGSGGVDIRYEASGLVVRFAAAAVSLLEK